MEINTKAKVSYCGSEIPDFSLPSDLSEFKNQFISKFGLTNQKTPKDISSIQYEQTEVDSDSAYNKMLQENLGKNKRTIFVKTSKVPVHFEGEKTIDFEDEIRMLIEKEFNVAANNIKEGLTNHLCLNNCKKVRKEECNNCNKQIFGYLFKKISPKENDEYYCELCSTQIDEPMFKIY